MARQDFSVRLPEALEELTLPSRSVKLTMRHAASPFWKNRTVGALVRKTWTKRIGTSLVSPIELVALAVCCEGYSFSHLNVKLSDSRLLTYAWGRVDSLRAKLHSTNPELYSMLTGMLGGRSCAGYCQKTCVPLSSYSSVEAMDFEEIKHDLSRLDHLPSHSTGNRPRVFNSLIHYCVWMDMATKGYD